MKICETCGGTGTHVIDKTTDPETRKLCPPCWGTGSIPLGPEGTERWQAKRLTVYAQAVAGGHTMHYVRVEPRGWAWQPITQDTIDEMVRSESVAGPG